ncbi:hypothetical protein BH11ARM2_BH11ARM2_07690 [soil metagenome]
MKHSSLSRSILAVAALATVGMAGAQTIRRNTVVPIRFQDTIRMSDVRVGDPIRAYADGSRDIPAGSIFEGRVRSIHRPTRNENGYVEFEFNTLRLSNRYDDRSRDTNRDDPWRRDRNDDSRNDANGRDRGYGQTYAIRATPIPINDRYTSRDRDGRITARQDQPVGRDTAVIGGGIAGLALGSLIHKPLEGAIIGALGGILIAETSRSRNSDVVIDRNTRMGAAFQRDLTLDGYDRDDRWDRDRDQNRDDPWRRDRDDNWNRDRDDDQDANYNPTIRYRDRDLRFDGKERPYRLGSTAMLPVDVTARMLGIRFDDRNNRTITLDGPDGSARIARDSAQATIDGRTITLDRPVIERDGVLYAPAELFARILRENLTIDGTTVTRR